MTRLAAGVRAGEGKKYDASRHLAAAMKRRQGPLRYMPIPHAAVVPAWTSMAAQQDDNRG